MTPGTTLAVPTSSPPASLPFNSMLKITQTHFFMGKNLVYIARNGLRIDNVSQLQFVLVARAPTWEITVYNKADKTFYNQKYADFLNSGILSKLVLGENLQDLNNPGLRHSQMKLGSIQVERLTANHLTVKYISTERYTAPQVERILFAVYQLPAKDGIPIGLMSATHGKDMITGLSIEGQIKSSLDTEDISEIKIPANFFDPPKGFTRAKSMREVVSGESSRQRSEDFDVLMDRKN